MAWRACSVPSTPGFGVFSSPGSRRSGHSGTCRGQAFSARSRRLQRPRPVPVARGRRRRRRDTLGGTGRMCPLSGNVSAVRECVRCPGMGRSGAGVHLSRGLQGWEWWLREGEMLKIRHYIVLVSFVFHLQKGEHDTCGTEES